MNGFEDFNLSVEMLASIKAMGFSTPSSIQEKAMPVLLAGATDFIGLAATGTGKTAAFAIPLIERLKKDKRRVQCLILCPTRELALQVSEQINLIGRGLNVRALPVYGGTGYKTQTRALKNDAQIVVGTPGRVLDHLKTGHLNLSDLETLILDEADEMISMGFRDDLESILKGCPRQSCQIWLFSATMSASIKKIAHQYLKDPQIVEANRTQILSSELKQVFYMSRESDKVEILSKLIESAEDFYGLIFCQTKLMVQNLKEDLQQRGYRVDGLHGDKTQREREATLRHFRDRRTNILVCTDVASRGIDVKSITHVVNYSLPRETESYVHRIGRTARAGESGVALSLITPGQKWLIPKIERATKSKLTAGVIPTRKELGSKKVASLLTGFLAQEQYTRATELFSEGWGEALGKMSKEEIAGRFLTMSFPQLFVNTTPANSAGRSMATAKEGEPRRRDRDREIEKRSFEDRRRPAGADTGSHRMVRSGDSGARRANDSSNQFEPFNFEDSKRSEGSAPFKREKAFRASQRTEVRREASDDGRKPFRGGASGGRGRSGAPPSRRSRGGGGRSSSQSSSRR